ncbi:MAG: uroporphyrinogen-III C-methyltransferase, partial [Gammaproteobacteria bacterium]|nr:uroporphyrinogen-III C-methyltransferase [Gammaproteobacteria bacterium]
MMDALPLHFRLGGRPCLVVGGGEVAFRKVELLIAAGAEVTVVAPALAAQFDAVEVTCQLRQFADEDVEGHVLVVAATDDGDLNARVSRLCQMRHLPVNVVDAPALCTVTFPAIIDRSPVVLSVGTGGASPVLTRILREQLEGLVGEGYARLGAYLASTREALKSAVSDIGVRRRLTENFMRSSAAERVVAGGKLPSNDWFEAPDENVAVGEVYLVGAGPGDPDLLTLRALQLMQQADIVLYDSLVSDAVLARTRRDARRRFVGKRNAEHSIRQEELNQLMVELVAQGARVLRLKGGDPFVFGRGGEELEALSKANVPFQVVPGITAASGCASYAGIPLTHRDYAQSVQFVTGHPREGEVDLEWHKFAQPGQTIVFYMGLGGLARICANLMSHGKPADTAAVLVEKGTLPDQRIIKGTLRTLPDEVMRHTVTR